jgi:drug/metabolite transporter (DMT)-like permease
MRGYVALLIALSAIWGASYMFIKVGLRDFAPATLVDVRLGLAASVLLAFIAVRGRAPGLRRALAPGAFVGIVGMALPFLLISWGETHIESGIAGVANASVPIFVALLALRFAPSERLHGWRLAGLAVGLSGVGVVSGVHPSGGVWAIVGTLAVVLSSLCYAASALYVQRRIGVGGAELAAASTLCGAVVMLPFGLARIPDHVGWKPLASVAVLGVVATGVATLLANRLIGGHGPARAMLVNYLIPGFALLYGVAVLREPLTIAEVLGLALILAGVALASGAIGLPRRAPATQTQ